MFYLYYYLSSLLQPVLVDTDAHKTQVQASKPVKATSVARGRGGQKRGGKYHQARHVVKRYIRDCDTHYFIAPPKARHSSPQSPQHLAAL